MTGPFLNDSGRVEIEPDLIFGLTALVYSYRRRQSAVDGGGGYLSSRILAALEQIAAIKVAVTQPISAIPAEGNSTGSPEKIEQWKTVAKVAGLVELSPWRITQLCRAEKVRAMRVGRCWLVDVESAYEYVRHEGRRKADSGD